MEKNYIKIGESISFKEYLSLYAAVYKKMMDIVDELIRFTENDLSGVQVSDVVLCSRSDENHLCVCFSELGTFSTELGTRINRALCILQQKNVYVPSRFIDVKKEEFINIAKRLYFIFLKGLKTFSFKGNIKLADGEFDLGCLIEDEAIYHTNEGLYVEITINSGGHNNVIYYDLANRQLCMKRRGILIDPELIGDIFIDFGAHCHNINDISSNNIANKLAKVSKEREFVPLPEEMQEKLFAAMNTMAPICLTAQEQNYLKKVLDVVTLGANGLPEKNGILSIFKSKYYELDCYKPNKSNENAQCLDFMDTVSRQENSMGVSENKTSTKESIKSIIMNLKNSGVILPEFSKIIIPENVYFSEITSDKKSIDPFFKDPDVVRNCNLSMIDFTNADLRGAVLDGTGARVTLTSIYGASIEGASLRNISLAFQTLDGINANNADLRGTRVTVNLENASIVGTKFSSTEVFISGTQVLDKNTLRLMGINVEDIEESTFGLQGHFQSLPQDQIGTRK